MVYKDVQDEETALQEDELSALKEVEPTVVSDAELKEIESHLVRLYKNNLTELYTEPSIRVDFERFVKRPLYAVALHFCKGVKKETAVVLGISVVKLRNKLKIYYGVPGSGGFSFTDSGNRMCQLYKNYLEQILTDGISDKFAIIVDRAMYRAVMEFASDKLIFASKLLGVTIYSLSTELDKYFGKRKLLELGEKDV